MLQLFFEKIVETMIKFERVYSQARIQAIHAGWENTGVKLNVT